MLLIGVIAGGATMAFFTGQETISGNTFASGSVAISTDSAGETIPFSATGLVPGDSVTGCLEITNDGDLDMLFRTYATNVDESVSNFINQFTVDVILRPTDSENECPEGDYGPKDASIVTGVLLGDLVGPENALSNESAYFDEDWPLEEGKTASYEITVTLDPNTTNHYQNRTLTLDLQIDGAQADNQTEGDVQY